MLKRKILKFSFRLTAVGNLDLKKGMKSNRNCKSLGKYKLASLSFFSFCKGDGTCFRCDRPSLPSVTVRKKPNPLEAKDSSWACQRSEARGHTAPWRLGAGKWRSAAWQAHLEPSIGRCTETAARQSAGGRVHAGTRVKLLGTAASGEPCALWVLRLGNHGVLTVARRGTPRVSGRGGE